MTIRCDLIHQYANEFLSLEEDTDKKLSYLEQVEAQLGADEFQSLLMLIERKVVFYHLAPVEKYLNQLNIYTRFKDTKVRDLRKG